jgi:serine protease Do
LGAWYAACSWQGMRWFIPILLAAVAAVSCNRGSNRTYRASPSSVSAATVAPSGPILSYADVVDRVAPGVVTIRASQRVRAPQQFPFFDDPFFRDFFGGGMPRRQPQTEIEHALGSGVLVRADGYILTNDHVVNGAQDIRVDLNNRRTYSAKVVGVDPPTDLAVLKVNASGLPTVALGDSDKVRVGDVCLAVGNPLGIGETVTNGIISAKGRATETGTGSFQDFLQTDAPINKGNSGGALVNTRGELIGINSQILSPTGGSIGIGFAIPSNMARGVMNQLIKAGKVQRGMLGVTIQQVTPDLASGLALSEAKGILISGVHPGGPAEKAGLRSGDVILQMNGKEMNDANELRNEVAALGPGADVTLTILRNGSRQELHVRLAELSATNAAQQDQPGGRSGAAGLGIDVAPLTPDLARQLGVPSGEQGVVVTAVNPGGVGAEANIHEGDLIEEVNREQVRTPADVRDALGRAAGKPVVLLINREGQKVFVAVPEG